LPVIGSLGVPRRSLAKKPKVVAVKVTFLGALELLLGTIACSLLVAGDSR